MASPEKNRAEIYKRYPLSSILIYNGSTILHFLIGGAGIIIGYSFSPWVANLFGALYVIFSFAEMYLLMPFAVCPNCVYYRLEGSLCISGLNIFSRKIAPKGKISDFPKRGQGVFCPNNLYLASLIIPIVAIIPALIVNFSFLLLAIWLVLVGLLVFRFFVIFPKIACLHCQAKFKCPQAGAMGVREL